MLRPVFKKRSTKIRCIIGLFWALVLICGYLIVLQPVVSRALGTTDYQDGLNYYTDGSYKSYPAGDRLDMVLDAHKDYLNGEMIGFFHIDYRRFDNPFYGKYPDFFSVNYKFDSEMYHQTVEQIERSFEEISNQWSPDLYRIFQSTYSTGVDGDLAMLVVSDTYSSIACVFVSDYGKTRGYEVPLNRLLKNVDITGNP